jgi:hypothetical protein
MISFHLTTPRLATNWSSRRRGGRRREKNGEEEPGEFQSEKRKFWGRLNEKLSTPFSFVYNLNLNKYSGNGNGGNNGHGQ